MPGKDKVTAWADGKARCRWANPANALYVEYHDREWASPRTTTGSSLRC